MRVELVFEDWKKDSKGVDLGVDGRYLSAGDFHSGTMFSASIDLDEEQESELVDALREGIVPTFRLAFPYLRLTSTHPRRPLKRGNEYRYHGFRNSGFKIKWICLPGHPNDEGDGGLPGVCLKWVGPISRDSGFFPCKTEEEFWEWDIFQNACDPEAA